MLLPTLLTILLILIDIVMVAIVLLYERRNPSATLAWVLALVFLPFLGVVLYLLFGQLRSRRAARKSEKAQARLETLGKRHAIRERVEADALDALDPAWQPLLALGNGLAATPTSRGNQVDMLVDAEATYTSMLQAVRAAEHHVHACFYIIRPDEIGKRMREDLVEKAKGGVAVRVLYDGLGSSGLPNGFWDPLCAVGGEVAVFRPVNAFTALLPWADRVDYRNHRKIVVTDGRVAFTGGINVGREYLGLDPVMGAWRDTHIRIEGPAALAVQRTFLEDWVYATERLLDDPELFPDPTEPGTHAVTIVDSGPDRRWPSLAHMFVQAIASAQQRVWLATPYFVPNTPIEQGLIAAALRGVDVRILIPEKGDHRVVTWAARSYFRPLLEAGARIYLYKQGFMHAKVMLVDEGISTVGSANMDMRSFHLNYEQNAFVYGRAFAATLAEQFEADFAAAEDYPLERELDLHLGQRLVRAAARILSPLL